VKLRLQAGAVRERGTKLEGLNFNRNAPKKHTKKNKKKKHTTPKETKTQQRQEEKTPPKNRKRRGAYLESG